MAAMSASNITILWRAHRRVGNCALVEIKDVGVEMRRKGEVENRSDIQLHGTATWLGSQWMNVPPMMIQPSRKPVCTVNKKVEMFTPPHLVAYSMRLREAVLNLEAVHTPRVERGPKLSQFLIGHEPQACGFGPYSSPVSNRHIKFGFQGYHIVLYDMSSQASWLALDRKGNRRGD
ncbi:hypothetical protein C8A03DRAFT_36568 [Achaetomium macrosporum]|uniref:Uncharacterized protein n=1 Tax=Achaetomium macrosporum TaxID=79813 RepID=A0AAN7C540_9PEZI|nr:hypothetical protein C8A03DRAFT_36568 [Achaetomium macrosporum]